MKTITFPYFIGDTFWYNSDRYAKEAEVISISLFLQSKKEIRRISTNYKTFYLDDSYNMEEKVFTTKEDCELYIINKISKKS